MRQIDEKTKELIISILNCQETDAIYIFGSYGTKYFTEDSDIDILLLLNVPSEKLAEERKKIFAVADRLDLEYEVVLAPVLQSYEVFENYLSVSPYYQNVQREGVKIA